MNQLGTTGVFATLYIFLGSVALWVGITFINGTLMADRLSWIYESVSSPIHRMLLILPILGLGHFLFSIALKLNPSVAGPMSIILTVIPPIIYSLWLIRSYPNTRIMIYVVVLVLFAVLIGIELNKLQN